MAEGSPLRRQPEALDRESLQKITRGLAFRLRNVYQLSEPFIQRNLEDLVGQAVLEYEKKRQAGEKIDDPVAFTIKIGTRRAFDQLRREKSRRARDEKLKRDLESEVPSDTTEAAAFRRMAVERVRDAAGALPEEERRALSAHFHGLPASRAAREFGVSETTFRRRLNNALQTLKQQHVIPEDLEPDKRYEFEIGLSAHLSLTVGATTRLGRLHWLAGIFDRARDLAARLSFGGGDKGASGVATKALAVSLCGVSAAAAVCVVAGIGPELGVVGLQDHHSPAPAHASAANAAPILQTPTQLPVAPGISTWPQTRSQYPWVQCYQAPERYIDRLHRVRIHSDCGAQSLGIETAVPEHDPVPVLPSPPVAGYGSPRTPQEIVAEEYGLNCGPYTAC